MQASDIADSNWPLRATALRRRDPDDGFRTQSQSSPEDFIMKTATRIGSVILSLAAAGAVLAQGAPPADMPSHGAMGAMEFGSVDTNKDGRVSADEARSHSQLNSSFSTLDTDGDKYLSQSEFGKWKSGSSSSSPSSSSPGSTPSPRPGTSPGSSTSRPGSAE